MIEPFGIEIKFNILHKTGRGVDIKIMEATADYLFRCAWIIMDDPENEFNHEVLKCHNKLIRKAKDVILKISELRDENYE